MPFTESEPATSRESVWRLEAMLAASREGILARAADRRTLYANERLATLLGVPLAELYQTDVASLLEPDPPAGVGPVPRPRSPGTDQYDVVYAHPDGGQRIFSVAVSPLGHRSVPDADRGRPGDVLMLVADVTAARRTEERLRWQALHDPLTGLPNRALLVDRLAMATARQERTENASIAVLFLDLDEFKTINDAHGHETGDRVLAEVAARLASAVRRADTVARWGGDEFAVVCENADETAAGHVADRIRQSLTQPIEVGGSSFPVVASIGVAVSPPHEAAALLRAADAAMYDAKAARDGRVVVSEPTSGPG